jgi:hypothetical protein
VASISTTEVSITNIHVLLFWCHSTVPSELPFHTQRCAKLWRMIKLCCNKFVTFFFLEREAPVIHCSFFHRCFTMH